MKKALIIFFSIPMWVCCQRQTFDEAVAAEVERFNAQEAPKRVEEVMTQDSMAYDIATHTLSYFYTVEGLGEERFPKEQLQQQILQHIRSSIQLKTHKEHDVSFRYRYMGRQGGNVLLDLTVRPEDYK